MSVKKFYNQLECFRGYAALCVAAVHFNVNSIFHHSPFATGLFVSFFFTLSGFVISLNYFDKINNKKDLVYFVKKRFLRLYPLHFLFLFIFILIEILKLFLEVNFNLIPNNRAFSINDGFSLINQVFLTQSLMNYHSFNTPSWSISVELFCYIFFCLIIFKFKKKSIKIFLFFVIIFIFFLQDHFGFDKGYKSITSGLFCFLIGLIFSNLYRFIVNKNYVIKKKLIYFLFYSNFFLILVLLNIKDNFLIYPFLFSFLILLSCFIEKDSLTFKFFFNRFSTYLGKISYSIYLSHLFIFWSLTQFMRFVLNWELIIDENGKTKLLLSSYEANLMTIIAYALTIIFSHFLYYKVERFAYKKI